MECESEDAPEPGGRRQGWLWLAALVWSAVVGLALWWLADGSGGPSVWVFRESDLNQPAFGEKLQAIFRGELGLQRTYPWLLFGPFVALLAWHFPLERERLRRNLPLNVAACLAFVWSCQALDLTARMSRANVVVVSPDRAPGRIPLDGNDSLRPGPPPGRFPRQFRRAGPRPWSLRYVVLDLLAYGAISGLVHSVNFYGRLRERERRALVLEAHLAKARLGALQAQLQPHFLFNSLNAITTLLRRDPRLAETTLVALSELLRLALSQSEKQETALRDELEFVRRYLEIQRTRFGDKLQVEEDLNPQALNCRVPTLVLQPLVENAIRHGIEPADRPGTVRLGAARRDGRLVLTVEDDGVGLPDGIAGTGVLGSSALPSSRVSGTGIGLANLRDRLQALYGDRQRLELRPRAGGGVIVRVEVPWDSPSLPHQNHGPEAA
jgi:signal transduction histidine kinase